MNPTTTFAEVSDVEANWGELTLEEEQRVGVWLISASNKLRLIGRRRGVDVDAFIADDDSLTQAATDAVVESVRRRLINPTGVRQRSTSTTGGPYTESSTETIDNTISGGRLYFTDEDLSWLPTVARPRIVSFRVRSGFRS